MALRFRGRSTGGGGCPTLYATDHGTYVIQGWRVTDPTVEAADRAAWLDLMRATTGRGVPGNDLWLLDDERVLFNLFNGDGDWAGQELTTDVAVVELCRTAFESVWSAATPHANYRLT